MKKTLVTFLLDETGSMQSIKQDTIGGFNSYLETLQKSDAPIDFTLIKFDSTKIEKVCVTQPVKQVVALDDRSYQPGASTPLIDAAYKTIKAVEKSLNGTQDVQVVVCVQTDGEENASSEHTWEELNKLVKEKTEAGWQFNFLGTGIDAYAHAAKMGVAAHSTMSSTRESAHVRASFAAAAATTNNYARGLSASTRMSNSMRASAGDQHFAKYGVTDDDLDLTTPTAPAKAQPSVTSKKAGQAVEDFTL